MTSRMLALRSSIRAAAELVAVEVKPVEGWVVRLSVARYLVRAAGVWRSEKKRGKVSKMSKQILLMRHAEKPVDDTDPNLSINGQQRAQRLATYIPQTFGAIGFLFAAAPSKHSVRPIATITPLSKTIGVPINKEFADEEYPKLARKLLEHPEYDGSSIVVCWHHEYLPDFAQALGASLEQVGERWHSVVFNLIWRLDYTSGSSLAAFSSVTEPF